MTIGKHLIAGEWVDGERVFQSDPAHAPAHELVLWHMWMKPVPRRKRPFGPIALYR